MRFIQGSSNCFSTSQCTPFTLIAIDHRHGVGESETHRSTSSPISRQKQQSMSAESIRVDRFRRMSDIWPCSTDAHPSRRDCLCYCIASIPNRITINSTEDKQTASPNRQKINMKFINYSKSLCRIAGPAIPRTGFGVFARHCAGYSRCKSDTGKESRALHLIDVPRENPSFASLQFVCHFDLAFVCSSMGGGRRTMRVHQRSGSVTQSSEFKLCFVSNMICAPPSSSPKKSSPGIGCIRVLRLLCALARVEIVYTKGPKTHKNCQFRFESISKIENAKKKEQRDVTVAGNGDSNHGQKSKRRRRNGESSSSSTRTHKRSTSYPQTHKGHAA